MTKGESRIHQSVREKTDERVRQLCRDINNRADNRKKLQTLVVRLQVALIEEQYETRAVDFMPLEQDDPFDKIMVA